MQLKIKSKINGVAFFVVLLFAYLVLVAAIDIYVPGLPNIRDEFHVSEAYLNTTLFAFMIIAACSMLVIAPLSDRLGRKPVLITTCILFTIGSIICSVSPNVEILILGRVLQAFGLGGVEPIATMMVKEAYADKSLKLAMSCMQSLILVGPLLAPFVGTFILTVSSWRTIFIVLTIVGVLIVIGCLFLPETRPDNFVAEKSKGSLKALLSNRKFLCIVIAFSLTGLTWFAFVGVFPYLCLEYFGGTYIDYNILYATTCIISICAPFAYNAISKKVPSKKIFLISFTLIALSVVLLILFGFVGVYAFVAALLPYYIAEGVVRPMSYVILLDQKDEHVGTASSISNFMYSFVTAFGSTIATLGIWPNYIVALIVITALIFVVGSALLIIAYTKRKH